MPVIPSDLYDQTLDVSKLNINKVGIFGADEKDNLVYLRFKTNKITASNDLYITKSVNGSTIIDRVVTVSDLTQSDLQTELDSTQTGAGLSVDGKYSANEETNYIYNATSLFDADVKLDYQLYTVTSNLNNLQSEVDATQTGAGLSVDGKYSANEETDYIYNATSLFDADVKLDSELKTVSDSLNTLYTNFNNFSSSNDNTNENLQSEIDVTQSGAGLSSNGTYIQTNSAYISNATSLADADSKLASQLYTVTVDLSNLQSEIDATQSGAGLSSNGTYIQTNSAYISNATSLSDADSKLASELYSLSQTVSSNNTSVTNATSSAVPDTLALRDGDGSSSFYNLTATNNATVENNLYVSENGYVDGTLSVSGNGTFSNNLSVSGNMSVNGNLIVNGTTTSINTTNLDVTDAFVRVANGNTSDSINSGIYSQYSTDGKTNKYSGLVRTPGGLWRLFTEATSSPDSSDPSSFSTLADLEVNSVVALSDQRLKTNVQVIDNPLDRLEKLRGVTYDWIDQNMGKDRQVGVIAQEAREALPELTRMGQDGYLKVDYARINSLLIESVKELRKENQMLKEQFSKMSDMIGQLVKSA